MGNWFFYFNSLVVDLIVVNWFPFNVAWASLALEVVFCILLYFILKILVAFEDGLCKSDRGGMTFLGNFIVLIKVAISNWFGMHINTIDFSEFISNFIIFIGYFIHFQYYILREILFALFRDLKTIIYTKLE